LDFPGFSDSVITCSSLFLHFLHHNETKRPGTTRFILSPQHFVTCFIEHKHCEARINIQSPLSSTPRMHVVKMSKMDKGLGKRCASDDPRSQLFLSEMRRQTKVGGIFKLHSACRTLDSKYKLLCLVISSLSYNRQNCYPEHNYCLQDRHVSQRSFVPFPNSLEELKNSESP